MKTLSLCCLLSLFVQGCADDDSTSDNFRLQTEMSSTSVSSTYIGKSNPQAVQSITITSARLLISEAKLQSKDSVTEIKIKTGPTVLTVTSAGTQVALASNIPAGTYDKVNFKFHRLSGSEATELAGDAMFTDFVTPERYSVIFEGTLTDNGNTVPFVYKGKAEQDYKVKVNDFTINSDNLTVFSILLDVPNIFKNNSGAILDPRDPANANEIDKQIKETLKVIKKQ